MGKCGSCTSNVECPIDQECVGGTCSPCKADLQKDIKHCGRCGKVCPIPANAPTRCEKGVCGRGPCQSGFFDFDEQAFGCETSCAGRVCTGPTGVKTTVDNDLLPETGSLFHAASSGSSYGSSIQTSASFTNMGTLGESTPPGADGKVELKSSKHTNVGGFSSALRKK
jgi:hypothetical protein